MVGDEQGFLSFWDLNRGEVKSVNRAAHDGKKVDFVQYFDFEGKDLFVSGSGADNCLKVWNRQDPQDVDYYLLRKRQGCTHELRAVKFYDDNGYHLIGISAHPQSEIIDFSVLREDMTAKVSQKSSSKGLNKYTKTERDESLGQVLDFSFSTNRARDWANLITANKHSLKPCYWDLEAHSLVKSQMALFDKGRATKNAFVEELGRKKRFVTKVAMSNCGNFGVAGFSDGYLVKLSMQDGSHIRTFFNKCIHQDTAIKGLLVDSLNHSMVTADESAIGLWDFYSGLFQKKFEVARADLSMLCPDVHHSVFGAVVGGGALELFEFHSLKPVRRFEAVKGEVRDCCIIFNERKVIASTRGGGLEVWDIFTEKLVTRYRLEKDVVSLAVNADLSFLATVFEGERHVRLWHINKLSLFNPKPLKIRFASHLSFVGENKREHYFGAHGGGVLDDDKEIEDVDDRLYRDLEEALEANLDVAASTSSRKELLGFTDIPQNRWMPLDHIEVIEKRNKPEKNQTIEVPFFLDFDNPLNRIKQEMDSEVMKKETLTKSKIVKPNKKNEFLEEVAGQPSKLLAAVPAGEYFGKESKKALRALFRALSAQPASQINYFIRSSVFEDKQNADKLLAMMLVVMRDAADFDLKSVVLKNLIETAYSSIALSSQPLLERLLEVFGSKVATLTDSFDYLSCMLDRLSVIQK